MADPKASDPVEDTSSQVNLAILSSLESGLMKVWLN